MDSSFEADHAFVSAMTAASLWLYMGNGDGRQAVREDKDYQTRIAPVQTTFLDYPIIPTGKSKRAATNTYTDVNNVQSSQVSTLLTVTSFTTERDTTKAFTSLRGGTTMTKERTPFYAHIVRTSFSDGEQNTLIKRPYLHLVNNSRGDNMKQRLISMIESMHVIEFVKTMMQRMDEEACQLVKAYETMGVVTSENVPQDELLEQCLRAHGVETDSTMERTMYEERLFPHIYAICLGIVSTHFGPKRLCLAKLKGKHT